jgi:hypothetical protein
MEPDALALLKLGVQFGEHTATCMLLRETSCRSCRLVKAPLSGETRPA